MKHTLALSMIPVVLAWAGAPKPIVFPAAEIAVKNTMPEGVTARRADSDTFRLRWSAVAELPPAIEVHYVSDRVVDAETVASEPPAPPPSRQLEGVARIDERQTVGATVSARPHQVRKAALRSDVCSRHGMRKVQYGKRWRCRR